MKDILLVVASMVIFQDPVSGLQFFGYSIALGGLVWYKLGADGVKNGIRDAQVTLGNMRQENPTRAKVVVFGGIFAIFVLGYLLFGPSLTAEAQSPFAGQ